MKSKKLKAIVFETPHFKAQNDRYAKRAPPATPIYRSKILSAFNKIDTFPAF